MAFLATMKHTINDLGVNPLDQVVFRNIESAIVAMVVACCA